MNEHEVPPGWRCILRCYPEPVRRRHGAEMYDTFQARLRTARHTGRLAVIRLWLAEAIGALASGIAVRMQFRVGRRRPKEPLGQTHLMASIATDIWYAYRTLRRQAGTTGVILLTLIIGIGTSTAVFSVVKGVLLDPLPYPEANSLYSIWSRFLPSSGFEFDQTRLSPPEYVDYRNDTEVMEDVASWSWLAVTITDASGDPARITATGVSANFFDVLRVKPQIGRTFVPAEVVPSGPSITIIGAALWQTRFGGDTSIVGRTTYVNDLPFEIVGVMPEGFAFPTNQTQMWFPEALDPSWVGETRRKSHWLNAVARAKPGVTKEQVDVELATLRDAWAQEYPDIHTGHFLYAQPLLDDYVDDVRSAITALFAAVALVMLIVCANVAGVLLARGERRYRETALRTALGADRLRIMRQHFTEVSLIVLAGLLGGLGMAFGTLRVIAGFQSVFLPRAQNIDLDAGVLFFTVAVSVVVVILAGLAPAVQATRIDIARGLGSGSRSATTAGKRLWFRKVLVTAQVALAVLLITAAGLTARSFAKLASVDPGFATSGVLLARVSLPNARYPSAETAGHFWDALAARLEGTPGVNRVAIASAVPVYNSMANLDFSLETPTTRLPGAPAYSGSVAYVSPGYFETLGIPLRRGRSFTPRDDETRSAVAIINETMARMFWPDGDPVGQRLHWGGDEWFTIVGIVADAKANGLDQDVQPIRYIPISQVEKTGIAHRASLIVMLQTNGQPNAFVTAVKSAVQALDPALAVTGIRTLDETVDISIARPKLAMTLMGIFAAIALLLGTIGVFSVTSHAVAQRTREIGIRMALGARTVQMARLVLGQAFVLTGLGLIIGLAITIGAVRFLESLLFGVSMYDPAAFLAVPTILAGAALVAGLVPALRATRVQPVQALRSE